MEQREGFIFYQSFYNAIVELPEKNQLELYNAIASYSFTLEPQELTGLSKTIWILIKPQIEANNRRFENGKKAKNKQNGSKTEAKIKQNESKHEGKEKEKDKDKEKQYISIYPFDLFYQLYPKKEGRPKAESAFLKLTEEEKGLAIQEIKKHSDNWKIKGTERKFIPLPASWINAKRFLDEMEVVGPTEQERFEYMDTGSMKDKFDIIQKYRPEFKELRSKQPYTEEQKLRGKEIQTEFETTFNLK